MAAFELPDSWPAFADDTVRMARGHVELIRPTERGCAVVGWLLVDEDELLQVSWSTSDGQVGNADPLLRDDVAVSHPGHPAPERSGFLIRLPPLSGHANRWISITGFGRSGVSGTIAQPLSTPWARMPTPPPELIRRVAGSGSADVYIASGLRTFGDLLRGVHTVHQGPLVRCLDWGCGPGRVTGLLVSQFPEVEVHGCDIDTEAIDWVRANLAGVRPVVVAPSPPSPYPEGHFDLVLSHSVLTHLDRSEQQRWIAEVARVVRPGGTFATTIHGRFAARWSGRSVAALESAHILDDELDGALDGIAPARY